MPNSFEMTADIAKFNMIEQQIRPWEVIDGQVLRVFDAISRQDFVQASYKGLAYADCEIPVCAGVSMLAPRIEGRMLQSLLIEPEDNILEIGSGCGYITACLASLGRHVVSLDMKDEALKLAKANIDDYGLTNVEFKAMNAFDCEYDQAFDAIAVGGSVTRVPENLKQALALGGRMFIVVGRSPAMEALLITRVADKEWTRQSLFETAIPALCEASRPS